MPRRRLTLLHRTAVAGTAAACVLSGCAATPADDHAAPGGVRVAVPSDIPSFHPYSTSGATAAPYAYDSLVHLSGAGRVRSGLAVRWRTDATSATFTLRKGVTCSDGTELKASHVARSLTYAADPKNHFTAAQQALPDVPLTVTADDAHRVVTVSTASPFGFLVRTVGLLPVICPAGLDDPRSLVRATHGTGPYVLSASRPGGPYVFTRRRGYAWGPGGARTGTAGVPARIRLTVIPEESTATNLLLTGGLDIAAVGGSDRARLTGRGLYEAVVPTVVGLSFFNEAPGHPLGDPAVRRALVGALDREGLADVAIGGNGRPAGHLTARGTVCHTHLTAPHLSGPAALSLLREAGWRRAADGRLRRAGDGRQLRLRIVSSPASGSTLPAVAELMAVTWQELGVRTDLVSESLPALVKAMYEDGDFDVVMGSAPGPPVPAQLVPFFSGPPPPAGLNFAHIRNSRYTDLSRKALRSPDTSGCALWNRAAQALLHAADALPVADGSKVLYGRGVRFDVGDGGQLMPASFRTDSGRGAGR
ncbi:ABC transporter substrate-binding protein [Streptomyces sp. NBC_00455]|uniref:ABC transporter substrate-binding protein n=1 Tax=Streptomyces sp. NBC_00455 TaxID=2903654 RepID=UPI002E1CD8BF